MNQTDQLKVLNAGFMIIRERDYGLKERNLSIFCKTKMQPVWHSLKSGFPSKASRRIFIKNLLCSKTIIED